MNETNFVRVNNLDTNKISYFEKEEFNSIMNLLGENAVYEYVYLSPSNNIYRSEVFA